MEWLFLTDGGLFVLIGLVVLATPSPQPALASPVGDEALPPFKDTRRLLASQFIGNGLLAGAVGWFARDPRLFEAAALARIATIAILLAINVTQLNGGRWKRAPLYFITAALSLIALAYGALLLRG